MQDNLLICLSFLMALIGGTGLYMLAPMLMNIIILLGLIIILWIRLWQCHKSIIKSIEFNYKKYIIFIIYICFLLTYFLTEICIDSEFRFNANEGVMRSYSNLIRGLVIYIIIGATYERVNNSKIFVILPPLCLIVMVIGLMLESNQLIDLNSDVHEGDQLEITADNKLLARPGGFINANMTAALALIWFYITFESKLKSSLILEGLILVLTVSVCLITQSRAAIIFFLTFVVYTFVILRNYNLLLLLLLGTSSLIMIFYYTELDIINDLWEKLSSRGSINENSAQDRLRLINYAFSSFINAPIFGNGILYVAKTEGSGNSTHNQILEILTNFGLVGFFMYCILYLNFYHKSSFSYLLLCIFPTLFFSHNFFESSPFQVALAFAYNNLSKK